jgi:hypothetical protein
MSNKNLPIVLGLFGVGIITLIGGGYYFRQTAKEWVRESEAYDKAIDEQSREKQQRLTQQVENEYDPNYADEEGLFGSSSGDSEERISDLWIPNYNDRDSFSDKGGSKKNRKTKKSVSKRRPSRSIREKSTKNQNKKHKRKNKTNKKK